MRTEQRLSLPHSIELMTDMSYPPTNQSYLPPQYYQQPLNVNHGTVHVVSPPPRPEPAQRKRPKYTRSKTGCMTCRVKKIKCDETKPNCMRCTHGQRDCTWPEGVPARKKAVRKDSTDGRPSTAGSSGISDGSTPPTREHTPPRRSSVDVGIVPLTARRPNETYLPLHHVSADTDAVRRLATNADRLPPYTHHQPPPSNVLTMIPETHSYPARYDHAYQPHNAATPRHHGGFRPLNHEPLSHWNTPSDYFPMAERNLVPAHSPAEPHTRYQ